MFTQTKKPQPKLWVLTLGIAISVLTFAPPCFPLKVSVQNTFQKMVEDNKGNLKDKNLKSKITEFLSVWSNKK